MISKKAPAKINLYLRVTGKRADGYHEIVSLMQTVDLFDELTIFNTGTGIDLNCTNSYLPGDKNNLVYRAAEAFYRKTGIHDGIEIKLQKNIPVGAGLGGGSSDAAATLMALNEIYGLPLTKGELLKLGGTLGADVPFFIFGKTAWATGKGEILTETDLPSFWALLINPGFQVSTAEVYHGLNFGLTKKIINYSVPRLYSVKEIASGLVNDLELVTSMAHPILGDIKTFLLENGALGAAMTGSGPTMFGIFADRESVLRVKNIATGMNSGWRVFCVRSL